MVAHDDGEEGAGAVQEEARRGEAAAAATAAAAKGIDERKEEIELLFRVFVFFLHVRLLWNSVVSVLYV